MTQRVLVTAGGSGIGRAIAQCFLDEGARVHVCDIDQGMVDEFTASHDNASASLCNVGDPSQVAAMFEDIESSMGGLDTLVNNAGIGGPRGLLEDIALDDWQESLQVNLTGPLLTMQRVIPWMKGQNSGSIINIVTTSAKTALPLRTPYVASKCGLRGLTHNAARELGPFNIRVNGVFPGAIDNPRGRMLVEKYANENNMTVEESEQAMLSFISMRSWIDPKEIGDLCVFLASDKARHISGQEIAVDGNMEWEG